MNAATAITSNRGLFKTLLKFILLLLAAQAVRALAAWLLMGVIGMRNDYGQPLSLVFMACFVWPIVRPTWHDLGLDLKGSSRGTWWLYGSMALIVALLLAANYLMDHTLWLANLYGVILTPIIEEALFRGLGWGRISNALPQKWNNIVTWVLISLLFGLWHLGYADVILWWTDKPTTLAALPEAMLWKVLIGGFIGGAAGLARWKLKKLPGAVFVHAMFNIFGR